MAEINSLEVIFQDFQREKLLRDKAFENFQSFVRRYILGGVSPLYFIKVKRRMSIKNKVRSYKGIIPRGVDPANFIELEFGLDGDYCFSFEAIFAVTDELTNRLLHSLVPWFIRSIA